MRPIDADALVEQLSDKAKEMLGIAEQCQGLAINYYTGAKYGFTKSAIISNGLPTIEQKHGEWIQKILPLTLSDGHKDCVQCSNCRTHWDVATNYCPNCGAKMERRQE